MDQLKKFIEACEALGVLDTWYVTMSVDELGTKIEHTMKFKELKDEYNKNRIA